MTVIWLVVWLVQGTPHVTLGNISAWNSWALGLMVCAFIDVAAVVGATTRHRR